MKNLKFIFGGMLLSLLAFSCGDKVASANHDSTNRVAVNYPVVNYDTINQIDANGLRQGYWIFYGRDKKDSAFPPDSKWQEGSYLNGKKMGLWYECDHSGLVKTILNYEDDKIIDTLKSENSLVKHKAVNYIDVKGLREGWWLITGNMQKDPAFAYDSKFSEGFYILGKEEGEWIFYKPDGSVKEKITYKAGLIVK